MLSLSKSCFFPLGFFILFYFLKSKYIYSNQTDEKAPIIFELVENEFKPFIEKHENVIVMFYSPHCGHCHKMKPEYENLSNDLESLGISAQIARIDGTENQNILTEENVDGFPTIKLYTKEGSFDYKGERTSLEMAKWIKKLIGSPIIIIKNETEIEKDAEGHFVAYFEKENSKLFNEYEAIATKYRILSTFYALINNLRNAIYAVKEDDEKIEYNGQNEEELEKFIKLEAYPKLAILDTYNFEKYLNRNLSFAWLESSKEHYNKFEKNIRQASTNFKNELTFVWVDSDIFSSGENEEIEPIFMLNLINGTRFELDDPINKLTKPDEIIKFLRDALDGKIEPVLKSEEIPMNDEEPVKTLVAQNLLETAFQPDKDVMIEIYAPWCGHCKELEPIYTELGEHFEFNSNVIIAKMDGTTNESPSNRFEWTGFPTIFFIPAGSDNILTYSGERTKEALIKYIEDNGSYGKSIIDGEL